MPAAPVAENVSLPACQDAFTFALILDYEAMIKRVLLCSLDAEYDNVHL